MEQPLNFSFVDGVALIELDNPPVNALFDEMRDGIAAALPRLDADPKVEVVLIVSAGSAFCAGVDLKKTAPRSEPFLLHPALDAMDRLSKPLAAAINGAALGGGLELALACHYRLAGPRATLGLPEVDVGIIPGACGTQRLPRLVPLEAALAMAALGDRVDAQTALRLGLLDGIRPGPDFRGRAVAWARSLRGKRIRRTRDLPVQRPADPERVIVGALARAAVERPGETAPLKAIEAVRAALTLPFDDGVELERSLVTERKGSDEAHAMRQAFFARRAART
ncbi:enoyl-CoA hydratase/isomerase family protein [Sphingosinicella terrae]|uniref:enoyl-CoA hydratase/isomerase family protein n=1 Tax=Sphingosinicella terrae TaxID=2172047 RepID=UPI000E0D7ABC|nr:enoyl-CoA hydratase/isomerase family protein [Sphingosinicella terrae]